MSTLVRAGMTPEQRCRYVADLIEANPDHFDMQWVFGAASKRKTSQAWVWKPNGEPERDELAPTLLNRGNRPDATHCGTVACIAGWTISVTPPAECKQVDECEDFEDVAAPLLDITINDACDLFYDFSLTATDAAFLLRWHADELDRA